MHKKQKKQKLSRAVINLFQSNFNFLQYISFKISYLILIDCDPHIPGKMSLSLQWNAVPSLVETGFGCALVHRLVPRASTRYMANGFLDGSVWSLTVPMSDNCISLRTLGSSIGLNKIELKKRMHWKHRWKQKNKKDIEILDAYKPKPERFLALGKPSQLIEKQQLVQHITSKYKHLIKQIQVLVYLP